MLKRDEAPVECCEVPACKASGASTCVTWGHRLCYPHFADWTQGKAYAAGRPPTREEWAAFLVWVQRQDEAEADEDSQPDAEGHEAQEAVH